jgi:hypothetical protein
MAGPAARRLRYKGTCARCRATVYPGDRGYWDRVTRKVHCLPCGAARNGPSRAGDSAGREYERRRAAREARLSRLPFGAILARLTEPQHQRAWAVGRDGEIEAAKALTRRLRGSGVLLIHDRRKPGSRGNIDHVAIGPGGVTVIDSKKLKGPIRVVSHGLIRRDQELRVAGRDRSGLIAGVEDQVRAVRDVLGRRGVTDVPVLAGPRKVAKLARREGRLQPAEVTDLADLLERELPPA